MPYSSVSDLPDAVKKLSPKKQRQWLHVFNSAMERGAGEESAFAQAWGVVRETDDDAVREAGTYEESEHPRGRGGKWIAKGGTSSGAGGDAPSSGQSAPMAAAPGERTLHGAQVALRGIGMTLTHSDGEYRVNFKGGSEATAYYTNDLGDALETARAMSREGMKGARPRDFTHPEYVPPRRDFTDPHYVPPDNANDEADRLAKQIDADEIDKAQALYWFAADYHEGQASDLYAILSQSKYKPGAMESGPEKGSPAEMIYRGLVRYEKARQAKRRGGRAKEADETGPDELVAVRLCEVEVLEGVTAMTGSKWAVRVLRFGRSLNGWVWDEQSGHALVPHLQFAPVAVFESRDGKMAHASETHPHGPPLRNVIGHIEEASVKPDGVYGALVVNDDAQWVRDRLLGLERAGAVGKALGLSVDALASYLPTQLREGVGKVIRAVKQVFSVDLVSNPSADGRVLRAVAGQLPHEGDAMKAQVLEAIRKARPALLEGRAVESLTDEEVNTLLAEAMERPKPKPEPEPKPDPEPEPARGAAEPAWLAAARIREARAMVRDTIDKAGLPDAAARALAARFEGKTPEATEVEAAVKEAKSLLAALSPTGDPDAGGPGGGAWKVGPEPVDKYQAAMDALFDVTRESFDAAMKASPFNRETVRRVSEAVNKNPAGFEFRGLREAYITMTGDSEFRMSPRMARVKEATTTTWADILGNTLHRRLLMDYAEQQYNEASIAVFGRADDFKTREVVIGGYFVDLSTVAEAGPYVAIADPADEKVSYAISKRGNLFEITLEVIANDDVQWVRRAVGRLGRAARHTLAAYIWGMWNGSGAVYDVDSLTWFHATHANTGSTALTADATGADQVYAKIMQLAQMTEPTSGNALGFPPSGSLWLDVPLALSAIARSLNTALGFGATVANNIIRGMFGSPEGQLSGGEFINANPIFSDATDWGVHVDVRTGGRESIGVDFYQGRQEPELFLANQETIGAMFTNDKIQYKIRHIYGGDLIDYRGAAKNVVTGSLLAAEPGRREDEAAREAERREAERREAERAREAERTQGRGR